jgi:hypothetical protein
MTKRRNTSPYPHPPSAYVRAVMADGWRRCDAEALAIVAGCIAHAQDRASVYRLAPLAAAELRKEPVLAAAALRLAPLDDVLWPIALLGAATPPADRGPLTRLLLAADAYRAANHECEGVA